MNKPAMTTMRNQAQGGFTLIELIVVIVILGILAATALPKFTNLGGDARSAAMTAAAGSLNSLASMAHGQVLVQGLPANNTITMEGQTVNLTNGYPTANANTVAAAGMTNTDYTIITTATAASNGVNPVVNAGEILIQPKSISSVNVGNNCWVRYVQSAAAGSAPVVTNNATVANCQ